MAKDSATVGDLKSSKDELARHIEDLIHDYEQANDVQVTSMAVAPQRVAKPAEGEHGWTNRVALRVAF